MAADPGSVADVTLYPLGAPGFLNILRFGAVQASGAPVHLGPLLISSRAYRALPRRAAPRPDLPAIGPHVWAGSIYLHFGHFITETLPRLLAARAALQADPDLRLLGFAAPGGQTQIPPFATWFADAIGVDLSRLDIIASPTRVSRLILPPSPFAARFRYAPHLRDLIAQSGLSAAQPSGERIFLSRGKLTDKASRVTNFAEIEDIYARAGFTLLHPETLSLPDQIARITAAQVLAGENGSALHWSLYAPHVRTVHALGWSLSLQRGICALQGQHYVPLRSGWFGALKGRTQHVSPRRVLRALSA